MRRHVREELEEQVARGSRVFPLVGYAVGAISGRRAVVDELPHPADATTLRLKGYSQLDALSCGVVAGYMVASTLHPRVTFGHFYKLCKVDPQSGVTMVHLKKALEACDVHVDYCRVLSFSRIARLIGNGRPILCNVQHDGEAGPVRHWLVVYGYRRQPREIFVAGNGWGAVAGGLFSITGQHRVALDDFLKMFNTSSTGGHALVCSSSNGDTIPLQRHRGG